MRNLLIPLLAALAFPIAVNATNYVECEAIYQVVVRQDKFFKESNYQDKDIEKAYDRAVADFKKRGCYYY